MHRINQWVPDKQPSLCARLYCKCSCNHKPTNDLNSPRNPSWSDDDMSEYKPNFYEIEETITNPNNSSNQYYMNPNYPESGIFSSNSSSDLHSMASSSNLLAELDHDYMNFREPRLIKTCFSQKFEPCNVTIDEKDFHKKLTRAPKAKHNLNGNYMKSKLFKDLNDFIMNNELNSSLVYKTITSVLNARNLEDSWTIAQKVLYMGLKVTKLLLKEEIFGQLDDELESHIEDIESTISYLNLYLSDCSLKRTAKKEEAELVTRKVSPTKISSPLNNQMALAFFITGTDNNQDHVKISHSKNGCHGISSTKRLCYTTTGNFCGTN
uniref:Uncharacterized protein n=1 Tax=Acrobeloides nanus TaxID=290746 RepID=A0A914D1X2_9BILA